MYFVPVDFNTCIGNRYPRSTHKRREVSALKVYCNSFSNQKKIFTLESVLWLNINLRAALNNIGMKLSILNCLYLQLNIKY